MPSLPSSEGSDAPDVEGATRKAMQMLSALSDAAISGGRLSSEMSSCANASNAKCQPWSRQDYLSRLASFSPMTWFNKPLSSMDCTSMFVSCCCTERVHIVPFLPLCECCSGVHLLPTGA